MPMLVIYVAAIVVGAFVAAIVNAGARRRLVNPGLAAGVLSLFVAFWSATIAVANISAHPGLTPEAQGEIFGEVVGGPAFLALIACFIIYRKSARAASVLAKPSTHGRNRG